MVRNTTRRTLLIKHISPHITSTSFSFRIPCNNLRWPSYSSIIHELKKTLGKLVIRRAATDFESAEEVVGFGQRLDAGFEAANDGWACPC